MTSFGGIPIGRDGRGNTTSIGSQFFLYDTMGHQICWTDDINTLTNVVIELYDAEDRRVYRYHNGVERFHVWDGQALLQELDIATGTVDREYVEGPGIDKLIGQRVAGAPFAYHTDNKSTPYAATDQTGNVAERYFTTWVQDLAGEEKRRLCPLTDEPQRPLEYSISLWEKSERRSFLDFDLIDVLKCLEVEVRPLSWQARGVEALGDRANELHAISDAGKFIAGSLLIEIAASISQVIDGDFVGRHPTTKDVILRIRAIDSAEYCVETDHQSVLEKLRLTFRKTTQGRRT